jgi:hypothetical protein
VFGVADDGRVWMWLQMGWLAVAAVEGLVLRARTRTSTAVLEVVVFIHTDLLGGVWLVTGDW